MLLTDLTARLEHQQDVCRQLRANVESIRDGTPDELLSEKANNESVPHKASEDTIIRTSKFIAPQWWKQKKVAPLSNEEYQVRLQDCNRALRRLESLEVMHRNTADICQNLLQQIHNTESTSSSNNNDNNLQYVINEALKSVNARLGPTAETLAEMSIALRLYSPRKLATLHRTMDAFFRGRYGVQLLCNHYVALNKGKECGEVQMDCDIRDVIDDAVTEAKHLCEAHFMTSPDVHISAPLLLAGDLTGTARATIIRPWLTFTLVELLKNAMAVSVEGSDTPFDFDTDEDDITLPPIHIDVEQKDGYMLIHIHDQGGGLPKGIRPSSLFVFAQKEKLWDRMDDQTTYAMTRSPLRGLGAGLSLSRLTMQHFGGTVFLQNQVAGELQTGCTATIRLNLDEEQPERLVASECKAMRLEMLSESA
jgi:pyruvate dehydrogenase kinase 2/3/4